MLETANDPGHRAAEQPEQEARLREQVAQLEADRAILARGAEIYLQAIEVDPAHEHVTLGEAMLLTDMRLALEHAGIRAGWDDPDEVTVDELREMREHADPDAALGIAVLFHRMIRADYPATSSAPATSGWAREGHDGCASCTCPPKSVGHCLAPGCGIAIVSVSEAPPRWCGKTCYTRWLRAIMPTASSPIGPGAGDDAHR